MGSAKSIANRRFGRTPRYLMSMVGIRRELFLSASCDFYQYLPIAIKGRPRGNCQAYKNLFNKLTEPRP